MKAWRKDFMEVKIILALCGLLGVQQAFYMWQIQKLVDKLMAKSYTEYTSDKKKGPKEIKVPLPAEPPEDLRSLQEFTIV